MHHEQDGTIRTMSDAAHALRGLPAGAVDGMARAAGGVHHVHRDRNLPSILNPVVPAQAWPALLSTALLLCLPVALMLAAALCVAFDSVSKGAALNSPEAQQLAERILDWNIKAARPGRRGIKPRP